MQDTLHNEKALLQAVSEGDKAAFTALFHHYKGSIYSTVLRLTDHAAFAEEVVQDVFLKIWLKRADMKTVENFPGYLYTIARRNAYRALKSAARQRHLIPLHEDVSEHPDVEQIMHRKEYSVLLKQAVERLPPKQQAAFILIRQEGLKREQAARQMQVSPETIKYNLEEATRKVRAYLLSHSDLGFIFILFLEGFGK